MSSIATEFVKAVEQLTKVQDEGKYNISLGYFQEYSDEAAVDPSGTRFANLKLSQKDPDGNDIGLSSVPLMFQGNGSTVDDFTLENGDELLVLFSDYTLAQWTTATEPQLLENRTKDSINNSLAIPISTKHSIQGITSLSVDASVGRRILVKSGKKIQIGNDTDELLKIVHSVLTEFKLLVGATLLAGSVDAVGSSSTGTNSLILTGLATMESNITALQTQLANIAKI